MCRIAGFAMPGGGLGPDAERALIAMRDSMSHGGPDDAGTFIDHEAGFAVGHRRLSILDPTTAGHQPMLDEMSGVCLAYNGEVYNFAELRGELTGKGHAFRSGTDTEVVLRSYLEWGEDAFSRLEGMFAFSVYDGRHKRHYLVRDREGIKPMYYGWDGGRLVFASEVRSFTALKPGWRESDGWRVLFLLFGHIPEPHTTLEGVRMLPAGSFMRTELADGETAIRRYADAPPGINGLDADSAARELRDIFTAGVARHLVSDAPLGVFLSGGVDSTLVALAAARELGGALRTLAVVFEEEDYSEAPYQRMAREAAGSEHSEFLVTARDFADARHDIMDAMDQPTVDGVNTYFITRSARELGLKVVLSGIGGDELFGGYPSILRAPLLSAIGRATGPVKGAFGVFEHAPGERAKKLSYLSLGNPMGPYMVHRGLFTVGQAAGLLGLTTLEVGRALDGACGGMAGDVAWESRGARGAAADLERGLYMRSQLLRDTDFMGMWHSVEVRVPFLDTRLVGYALSLDDGVRFGDGGPKGLLKRAFADVLPPEIARRAKAGFTFPFARWLTEATVPLEEAVRPNGAPGAGVLRGFREGRTHWSRLWALCVMNGFSA